MNSHPPPPDLVRLLPFTLSPGSTRVGLVTFGKTAKVRLHLAEVTGRDLLLNALHFSYESSSTNAADALRVVREEMFTPQNGDR